MKADNLEKVVRLAKDLVMYLSPPLTAGECPTWRPRASWNMPANKT